MLYLDRDDIAPIDIQPRLHFGEKNSKPVTDCLDIIWSRKKSNQWHIAMFKKIKKTKTNTVGVCYTCVS